MSEWVAAGGLRSIPLAQGQPDDRRSPGGFALADQAVYAMPKVARVGLRAPLGPPLPESRLFAAPAQPVLDICPRLGADAITSDSLTKSLLSAQAALRSQTYAERAIWLSSQAANDSSKSCLLLIHIRDAYLFACKPRAIRFVADKSKASER